MQIFCPMPGSKHDTVPGDMPAIKHCRTSYDHLAGKPGVAIADSLLKQKIISAGLDTVDYKLKICYCYCKGKKICMCI